MQINTLSQANQNFLAKDDATKKSQETTVTTIKNGKKLLAIGASALSAAAIAGIALYKKNNVSLSDINFNRGIATLKRNGEKFSGKIHDHTPSGNKIKLTYKNGVLRKSKVRGSENFTRTFIENEDGTRIVTKVIDHKKETVTWNMIQLRGDVREQQEKIQKAIESGDYSKEFIDELTTKIQYISKAQKRQLSEIIREKKDIDPFIQIEGNEVRNLTKNIVTEISGQQSHAFSLGLKDKIKTKKMPDGQEKKYYDCNLFYWEKLPDNTVNFNFKFLNSKFTLLPSGDLKIRKNHFSTLNKKSEPLMTNC